MDRVTRYPQEVRKAIRTVEASIRSIESQGNTLTHGNCFVTGSTGLVGNNVVRQLLSRGYHVRALVRPHHTVDTPALAGLAIQTTAGTLSDERS